MAGTPKPEPGPEPQPQPQAPPAKDGLDRQEVTNILTLLIVGVWIITAVVRIWVDWPQAVILDSAMPIVLAYWFASTAARKNGVSA